MTKLVAPPETLWYEDQKGNVIPHVPGETPFREGNIYQHTRSVAMRHNVLGTVQQADVDACSHDVVVATGGWIEGVEGRECRGCKGTQVRHLPEPWPEKWEGGSCYDLMTMNSGWDSNVVNAMVRSLDYDAKDAALISATSCERCWNVLLHHYYLRGENVGDDHGYPIGSDEEALCGTSCILCAQVTEMCKGDSVSCNGTHDFEEEEDFEGEDVHLDHEGKPAFVCCRCGVPGVSLDDLVMKRHLDAGGEELPRIVSETVYKYKVRGRVDKYQDNADCIPDDGPPAGNGCCC